MSTRVQYRVPVPRAGSVMMVFDVVARVEVHPSTTCATVESIACGEWRWPRPGVVTCSRRGDEDDPTWLEWLGLTDWERDYLRELALLAFRHSRLAWPGATTQLAAMRQGGWR